MSGKAGDKAQNESRLFFPLRSNVALFRTPAGFLSLEERLKVAALLYDRVILEGGFYKLDVTAEGSYDFHQLRDVDCSGQGLTDEDARLWREQAEKLGDQSDHSIVVSVKPSGSEGDFQRLFGGPLLASYFAEFQSLAAHFDGRNQSWVTWQDGIPHFNQQVGSWLSLALQRDELTGVGSGLDWRLRRKLLEALNRDLVVASLLNATIATDPLHSELMAEKVAKAGFDATLHRSVLPIVLPNVAAVPWNEIVDLRNEVALLDFRQLISEFEDEIADLPDVADLATMHRAVMVRWNERLQQALLDHLPTYRQVAASGLLDLAIEIVNLPVPGFGVAVSTAIDAYEVSRFHRSWLSVFMRLAKSR